MGLEELLRSDTLNVVVSARTTHSGTGEVVTLMFDNAQNEWVISIQSDNISIPFGNLKDALEFFVSTIEELPIDKGSTK
jgi:hypothetical protein